MPVERPPRAPVFPLPEDFPCPEFPDIGVCAAILPGGVDFSDPEMLRFLQPALAPLSPIFTVIEALIAVKTIADAVLELPDPQPLIDAIPGLQEQIDKLLAFLPQTALPKLVLDMIDCIISELEKLRRTVTGLTAQLDRIATVLDRAAELDDPQMNAFAVCATDRVSATLDETLAGLTALGRLLGVIGGFLELIGVDAELPVWSDISGAAIETILEPIDRALELLRTARELIPV